MLRIQNKDVIITWGFCKNERNCFGYFGFMPWLWKISTNSIVG